MIESASASHSELTRTALQKASWRLIPLLSLGYAIAFMDRVNISYASLQMNQDLHFSATVYGFGAGLFFLSYAACEIPSNLLLYRFGARRWLARIMITWGIVATCMMFVRTPWQFYLVRFLLGMSEAGFFPGVIYYLTCWFPPETRARTVSRFYVAFPLSNVLMGGVAGMLLNMNGRLGLLGWQWLFLLESLPAIAIGIVFLYLLPDSPAQARWLSALERDAIQAAVRSGCPPAHGHSIAPALRDVRVWLCGIFMLCMLGSSYAYSFSAPAIVKAATALSVTRVGFILALINLLGAVGMIAGGILSDRLRRTHVPIILAALIMVVCFVTLGVSGRAAFVLPAIAVQVVAYNAMQGPLFALVTSLVGGRAGAASIATMNMIGIVGGFLGPYWMGFMLDRTRDYRAGLASMAPVMLLAAFIMLYLLLSSRLARTPSAARSALEASNL